jgi:uncharacterized phage infection (PIP) family protein YhgE
MKYALSFLAIVSAALACFSGCGKNPLEPTVQRLESQLAEAHEQLKSLHSQLEAAIKLREASEKNYEDKLSLERQRAGQLQQQLTDAEAEAVSQAQAADQTATRLATVSRELDRLKQQQLAIKEAEAKQKQGPSPEGAWAYKLTLSGPIYRIVFDEITAGTGRLEQHDSGQWRNADPTTSNLFRYAMKSPGVFELTTAQEKTIVLRLRTANEGDLSNLFSDSRTEPAVRVSEDWLPKTLSLPYPEPAIPIRK